MARTSQPTPKGPDWSPDKTLRALRSQLGDLQQLRGRLYHDVQHEEEEWQQFTQSVLARGFREDSDHLKDFHSARWAGEHGIGEVSAAQIQRNFKLRIEQFDAVLRASIKELELLGESDSAPAPQDISIKSSGPAVFISHSSRDEALARAVVELLRSAMNLPSRDIRCSSVDGYRLPVGAHTEMTLREEVNGAAVMVGLLTPNSLASAYVMFELGARWGVGSFLAPLLAGVTSQDLDAPLNYLNVLQASNAAHLHQFVQEISSRLRQPFDSPASYQHAIDRVIEIAGQIKAIPVDHDQEKINQKSKLSPEPC